VEKGIAVLLKRNGNYLESLKEYLELANKLSTVEIMKELV
jgi:hypothetical protein